jgi:hypothetical protein
VTDTHILLALLGLAIGFVLLSAAYWVWLDAKEAAERRRWEAEMTDAYVRAHRRHQHDDRHTHEREGAPE